MSFNWLYLVDPVLAYFIDSMPQQNAQKGEFAATAADEGNSLPVIFGTCDVSPNITAFLAGTPQAIKK